MTRVQGITEQGSLSVDNLIAGEFPKITRKAIITGGEYQKGTILAKITASGKYTICIPTAESATSDGSEIPCAILAETIDATSEDKEAVIYLTGEFNSSALTAGTGNTVAGLTDALRDKGIFLKENQSI